MSNARFYRLTTRDVWLQYAARCTAIARHMQEAMKPDRFGPSPMSHPVVAVQWPYPTVAVSPGQVIYYRERAAYARSRAAMLALPGDDAPSS